ncbi:MAG: ROK family protein [Candidatus Abyssobacteria bacterium SURF_5]|uniref:Glucokinase n=1 Tax=Abyssobacteria bacterium (strain SURF_5) TaxID=2093360 RepID=A0A3A4NZM8_ABYX5|nr:MAG: ROK family protein [Candidatus Abyssubacteria bacterium SURF_5]
MGLRYYIGVDIGATWIKIGLVTREGQLVSKVETATRDISSPADFLASAKKSIGMLLEKNDVLKESLLAIGVGAPGWVNYAAGIVNDLTNIPGWQFVPLAKELERSNHLPAFVDNDANVMAIGEMVHGAGKGFRNFVCLTLGTGVGGAIVIDRDIYRGMSGLAGEIGHMTLDMNGRLCACGAKGCLERYVGNRFIVQNAVERLREQIDGKSVILELAGNQVENITPKLLSEAAAAGDEIALDVWRETGIYVGVALAVLVNLLNPECFIIGGGVANAGEILFDPMRESMESLAMNQVGKQTPVFQARLGKDAGMIGAATFAMTYLEKNYPSNR